MATPIWKDGFYYTPTATTSPPPTNDQYNTLNDPTQYVQANGTTYANAAVAQQQGVQNAAPIQPTNPTNAPNVPTPQVAGDATTNLANAQSTYLQTLQNQPSAYDLYQAELKNRGIDALTQQEADIGKSANAQEAALKPLLPENVAINFPKSLQQLQDIGVNQDQLNLLAAKERTPIASALSDLLKSQSIIAQQIDRQISFAQYAVGLKQQDAQRQAQIAELKYNFAKELADGTALSQKEAKQFALENNISKPYYNIGGTVYRTSDGYAFTSESDFQSKEKLPVGTAQAQGLIQPVQAQSKAATSDIAEYQFAQQQGYKGTFQQWIDRQTQYKSGGGSPSTTTGGFLDSKVESDIRGDAADLLYNQKLSPQDVFTRLRTAYSPQEVSDKALRNLLGIPEPTPPPTNMSTSNNTTSPLTVSFNGSTLQPVESGITSFFSGLKIDANGQVVKQ